MPIWSLPDHVPNIAEDVFIAPTAYVIGAVSIGSLSSIWFGSTLRADCGQIQIGSNVNIQESSTLHIEEGGSTTVGDRVSLGHHCLVHSAYLEDDVLIGMNASVLSGAHVGAGSIVASHSLVTEGMQIPPGSLVMGTPGRVVRALRDDERERVRRTAAFYSRLTRTYLDATLIRALQPWTLEDTQ